MPEIKTAMVLAAGFGQRARPLSLVRPKPLFPVLNIPLLDRILHRLKVVGVKRAAINTHHMAEAVIAHLEGMEAGMEVHTLTEKPEILGTGGGLKNAEAFLAKEPFYVVNADVYSDIDLLAAGKTHFAGRALATLVMHDYPLFNQVAVDDKRVVGFRNNRPDESDSSIRILAFTGVHVVDPGIFKYIPTGPGDIIDVYQTLIDQGDPPTAHVEQNPVWHDAGTRERYLDLHRELLTGRNDSSILIDATARVEDSARLEGFVCIGAGAVVEDDAVVRDSVLWPGSRVARGARVINSVVADKAVARESIQGQSVVDESQISNGH